MPKYFCDYCDTYLTHDSPSVRKTHNNGRKHKDNVKFYYAKWMEDQAQALIDQTIKQAEKNAKNQPNLPNMAPGMMPPPGMMPGPGGMMPGPGGMMPGPGGMMPPMMGMPPGMMPGMPPVGPGAMPRPSGPMSTMGGAMPPGPAGTKRPGGPMTGGPPAQRPTGTVAGPPGPGLGPRGPGMMNRPGPPGGQGGPNLPPGLMTMSPRPPMISQGQRSSGPGNAPPSRGPAPNFRR